MVTQKIYTHWQSFLEFFFSFWKKGLFKSKYQAQKEKINKK